jgi:hypothetical protein
LISNSRYPTSIPKYKFGLIKEITNTINQPQCQIALRALPNKMRERERERGGGGEKEKKKPPNSEKE